MDPELWRRIDDLFHRALALEESRRGAFLDEECGDNQELRREVESLLALDPQAKGFIESPAAELVAGMIGEQPEGQEDAGYASQGAGSEGTTIGPYRLIRLIGEGGMGEVWLAEQMSPVRRQVALKLIKIGMDTREWTARFQSERQALAMMDHPAIAKVFDAGTSPDGRPYFVMEYVPGLPITTYCDLHRYSLRQRLELFVLVCEGVQHAHQKAVIHRDLKPSNILVTELDGKALPRIIDFGVAKATSQPFDEESFQTHFGSVIGTLGYMSPEQADSAGQDIDTRSDVYSLGVVLYELMAGSLPLDFYRLAYDEVLRRLREQDPPSPSTKVRTGTDGQADAALKRGVDVPTLTRQLRGDPDAIALKALEKDRNRRYATASDLAADIGRYLRDEPVTAHAPSGSYRLGKYVRRHRALAFGVAAVFVTLVAGVAVSTREAVIARRAEVTAHKEAHRADLEAASAQAVVDFLEHDLLAQAAPDSQAQPGTRPDPDLKVRTALDRASQGVSAKFKSQPEVEASVRETIGKTYKDLGFYPEALTQIERALELRRNLFGAEDPRTLETTASLGLIFMFQGKYAEAEKLLSPALEVSRRVLGPEDPATATMMNELATAYFEQDKVAQAEALWKQTLDLRRKLFGPESPKTLGTMNNLTLVSIAEGKFSQAESLDLALLEIHRRKEGPEQPETLGIMHNLAMDYLDEGKYAEALALFRQILPLKQSVMGPEHPETLAAKGDLAEAYAMSGQTTEAEKLLLEATTDMRRKLTREDPVTLGFLLKLGSLYQMEGKYGEARAVDAQALAGFEHLQGKENVEAVMASTDVAFADLSLRKFAESEARSQEALSASHKVDPDHWRRYWAESLLGASLAGEKKFTEAEPRLIEAYAGLTARRDRMPAPDRYRLRQTRTWIVDLYRDWGQPEKADAWSRK